MAKIIGNTTATPNRRPDWAQTDATKADYIKNRPEKAIVIDESSTDEQYATAKAVYDYVSENSSSAQTEIVKIATEKIVNDYAIHETIYIGLDGYGMEFEEGYEPQSYPITNLDITSSEVLSRYNFVLYDYFDGYITHIPLTAQWNDTEGSIMFSSFVSAGCNKTYYAIDGYYNPFRDEAVTFTVFNPFGEGIETEYGVVSVDKNALLGDVEAALTNIVAIKNSLLGGVGE